jgi:hypothetical protein
MHHVPVTEVPKDLPVYTIIRNPYDQLLSWYYHAYKPQGRSFLDFIETYSNGRYLYKSRLNIYREVVTRHFVFERGLQRAMDDMGFPDIMVGWTGKTEPVPDKSLYLDDEAVQKAIQSRFAADIELYEQVTGESNGR